MVYINRPKTLRRGLSADDPSNWLLTSTATQLCLSPCAAPSQSLAGHPHHTLYKLPLHLTCPSQLSIIDEWVALRSSETAWGGAGEDRAGLGGERSTAQRYYLNKLTPTRDTAEGFWGRGQKRSRGQTNFYCICNPLLFLLFTTVI